MSQLSSPSSSTRASNLLPTVKCSNCALPVPLSSLSEHLCPHRQSQQPSQQPQSPQSPHRPSESGSGSGSQPIATPPTPPHVQARLDAFAPTSNHVPFPTVTTHPPRPEDYMPGGESGMAGVGRRAFQAAAHAALFAQHSHHHNYGFDLGVSAGMQGRRPNMPQFLDITSAISRGTPPLSPNSTHSSPLSHSPHSPLSQSPLNGTHVIVPSRTPSPSTSSTMTASRPYPNAGRASPQSGASTPTSDVSSRLPFFQRYKNALGGPTPPVSRPPSSHGEHPDSLYKPRVVVPGSPTGSDYSDTGLAYDRDEDEDDGAAIRVGRSSLDQDRASVSSYSAHSATTSKTPRLTRDDLLVPSPRRSHTTPTVGPRGGAGGSPSPLPPIVSPGPGPARSASDAKDIRRDKDRARRRMCIRCERNIDDGHWVRTETNKGVLCERCWKNMYLPKCRRCDKPIEKAAVFSSDGQLKGKYHRECFNCHTCHAPFPDKSFYVYGGQPMCAFHYHKANGSLCAATTCGQPIEGPCAITYTADKYHPDCLRCAHPECEERLDDYWDIDGMMFCEHHAQRDDLDMDFDEDEEEEDDYVGDLGRVPSVRKPAARLGSSEARAQKRTTRLINLSGNGFGLQ